MAIVANLGNWDTQSHRAVTHPQKNLKLLKRKCPQHPAQRLKRPRTWMRTVFFFWRRGTPYILGHLMITIIWQAYDNHMISQFYLECPWLCWKRLPSGAAGEHLPHRSSSMRWFFFISREHLMAKTTKEKNGKSLDMWVIVEITGSHFT